MSVLLSVTADSPEATRAIGARLGETLGPGDIVALAGELGAGKTCLVQGVAAGLGIAGRVTSPTFVLARTYHGGRLPLVHVDVYRLDNLSDIEGLGDDVLAPDVATVVEWGDTIDALLPQTRLLVDISHVGDGDERSLAFTGSELWTPAVDRVADLAIEGAGVAVDARGSARDGG